MTRKEKEKIIKNTKMWFKNCKYYEEMNMQKSLRFEIGRLAGLLHLCYDLGIDPEIDHSEANHFIMYQKEKENWIE